MNTKERNKANILLIAIGSFFVLLGTAGIFVPILPTTPFLLLAAACYAKGSKKLYKRLIQSRILGKYIRDYREGKGIPLSSKIFALTLLWVSIGSSVVFFVYNLLLQIMLLLIAAGVTIHLLSIKTYTEYKEELISETGNADDFIEQSPS
jgi:uncharacterized membrane protein YbaN (DUF454 family)